MKENKKQVLFVILIFILLIAIGIIYMSYMLEKIETNTSNSLKTIVETDANNLKNEITKQKAMLQSVTNQIVIDNIVDEDKIFDIYERSDITSTFIRMGIMYEDGTTITNDGYKIDYSDEKGNFFSDNKIQVSENRISKIDGERINIYSQVINVNDESIAILLIVKTDSYKDIFSNKIFEGNSFSYIVNKNEEIVVNANNDIKEENLINNIEEMLSESSKANFSQVESRIKNDIEKGLSGTMTLDTKDGKYYMTYQDIGINNWVIFSFIPSKAIAGEINKALFTTFVLSIIVITVILLICIYIVISNIKKQRKLYQYAYIDPVTGKGNVYYFRKIGQEILEKDNIGEKIIIVLDINKFKMINKSYGYKVGDEILKNIAQELEKILGKNSLISRYSNDYFVMLFENKEDILKLLNNIIWSVENLKIGDNIYTLSINMGIYKLKKEDKNISEVMDKALIAHSASKGDVFDKYHIYDEEMEKELEVEEEIEKNMEKALKHGEFKVYYQPKIYAKNEKIYGAEALVRWEKDGKIIAPNKFIPIFEKNRFILKLDLYIFENVCRDIKKWKGKYNDDFIISINISRQHFMENNFLEKYMMIAAKYGVDTSKIDLEITESTSIDDGINMLDIMNKIKKLGFLISIDDFGTGYSSLSMLQDMPVDILKVDKSFIDRIEKNDRNIVKYILNIAKELNLKTIAEGVETKQQKDYLTEMGCDIIQGYYYAKPMKSDEFEEYIIMKLNNSY